MSTAARLPFPSGSELKARLAAHPVPPGRHRYGGFAGWHSISSRRLQQPATRASSPGSIRTGHFLGDPASCGVAAPFRPIPRASCLLITRQAPRRREVSAGDWRLQELIRLPASSADWLRSDLGNPVLACIVELLGESSAHMGPPRRGLGWAADRWLRLPCWRNVSAGFHPQPVRQASQLVTTRPAPGGHAKSAVDTPWRGLSTVRASTAAGPRR
jgi:hypothetical protein